MKNYLAFDLGASSGKLFLGQFDGERLRLVPVHRFENGPVQLGMGLYWDFPGIYRSMAEGICKAAQKTGNDIASFGVDTFSNDFSLVDKEGFLLSPMFCYRDQRTARCREAIYKKVSPREFYNATGNQVALFNTSMQLASMKVEGRDAVLEQADKLLFLPDLLMYYLTGTVGCEYTVASVSQLYDYDRDDWSTDLMDKLSIPRGLFAGVVKPGAMQGRISSDFTRQYGVKAFDTVSVCQHDTASAFLSAMAGGRSATLSSGTWAIVGTESDGPIINDFGYRHNIANEGGYAGHHRLLCSLMGNWILQEARREYALAGQRYSFEELGRLASAEQALRWYIDVDNELFFTPGSMLRKVSQKCRELHGTEPRTPGQVTRCICESLVLKCLWTIEKLETLVGYPMSSISVIGGGSRDSLACQFLADAARRPVLAGPAEASALGNIMVQMIAAGQLAGVEQGRELIRRSFPGRTYYPECAAHWQETYHKFKDRFGLAL